MLETPFVTLLLLLLASCGCLSLPVDLNATFRSFCRCKPSVPTKHTILELHICRPPFALSAGVTMRL
ncbi:GPI-anchored surface protein, putative, partial [Bodo saltans]